MILVVYNTCGLRRDNYPWYSKSLDSILCQEGEFDVIYSGCMNQFFTKNNIKSRYGDKVSMNFVNEIHPVNVTFNHSVKMMVDKFGEYDGYMYVDSGSIFPNVSIIKTLARYLASGKYGMITPQPSVDTEYFNGLGVGRYFGDDEYARSILFKDGDYIIPIGKGMATHVNLISNEMRSYYGRVYPDIFAGHCTESTFTFLCSALAKQWILIKDIIIDQNVSLDGQSSGFNTGEWVRNGGKTYEHPYKIKSILERVLQEEPKKLGFGYEECNNILRHDPNQFDDDYLCKNDLLKVWIKDNLFLKKEELDYDKIDSEFIP